LNVLVVAHAGLSIPEGSIELKAMDKKKVCNIACVFSVYENPATYKLGFSDNLNKFVDKIEPDTFTLSGFDCPAESVARRNCIRNLCYDPNSTSTAMPCIYFSGPSELSFETCDGIPCNPQKQRYVGAIKAMGTIGAATTVEPLDFIIYYTPISGWPLLAGGIIIVIIIIFLVVRRTKKMKKIVKFCKKCNKEYKEDVSYCPYCGSPLVKKEK